MIRRALITSAMAGALTARLLSADPGAPAAQPSGGRVVGSVKLTLASGGKSAASAYERRGVAPRAKSLPEMRNVVIYVAGLPASADMPATRASISQRDEQFAPHLVAITAGSSVAFPNQDPFFHNVFSLSRGATFDLGRYPSGATRSHTFTQPGIVKVFCHIHSHMSAVVRVFDHPWFTIPSEQGTFALDEVPPGQHTLVAWHERIGEQRARVTIRPGQAAEIHFTLPVLEPSK